MLKGNSRFAIKERHDIENSGEIMTITFTEKTIVITNRKKLLAS